MDKRVFRITTTLSALLVVASCVRNPATGRLQLNFVSRDQEIALGEQGAQEVQQSIGYYDEKETLEQYVQRLGNKLASVSERPKLPWSFHVVDDATVNAFALPGGQIYVTRGILAHLDNEAQLASVLGHEIGHVTARHSANQMSKAAVAQVGLGLGAMLSDTVAQLLPIGSAGLQLMFLKFSRDHERQADQLGFRYAMRAGYDVREMPKVFAVLKRVSESGEGGGRLPSWLATHPDPAERVKTSEKRVAKVSQDLSQFRVGRDTYLQQIDGMVYGEDPREGFFRGNTFYQPELAFQVTFPDGWQKQNTKQAVVAASPEGDAAMQLTLAPEKNAEAAMQAFFEKSGATPTSRPKRTEHGIVASFSATSEQGDIAGRIAYIDEGAHVYQLVGLSTPERLGAHEAAIAHVMSSFRPVKDAALLAVKPKRLQIERLSRPMPVEAVAQANPAASADELALVNQVDEGATIPAGQPVKIVEGGPESVAGIERRREEERAAARETP